MRKKILLATVMLILITNLNMVYAATCGDCGGTSTKTTYTAVDDGQHIKGTYCNNCNARVDAIFESHSFGGYSHDESRHHF